MEFLRPTHHGVLVVVFHGDLAHLRTGHGPQNMAIIKHMTMNMIRHPKDKHSLKIDEDYMEALVGQTPH